MISSVASPLSPITTDFLCIAWVKCFLSLPSSPSTGSALNQTCKTLSCIFHTFFRWKNKWSLSIHFHNISFSKLIVTLIACTTKVSVFLSSVTLHLCHSGLDTWVDRSKQSLALGGENHSAPVIRPQGHHRLITLTQLTATLMKRLFRDGHIKTARITKA